MGPEAQINSTGPAEGLGTYSSARKVDLTDHMRSGTLQGEASPADQMRSGTYSPARKLGPTEQVGLEHIETRWESGPNRPDGEWDPPAWGGREIGWRIKTV
jgi:hypothetical protein